MVGRTWSTAEGSWNATWTLQPLPVWCSSPACLCPPGRLETDWFKVSWKFNLLFVKHRNKWVKLLFLKYFQFLKSAEWISREWTKIQKKYLSSTLTAGLFQIYIFSPRMLRLHCLLMIKISMVLFSPPKQIDVVEKKWYWACLAHPLNCKSFISLCLSSILTSNIVKNLYYWCLSFKTGFTLQSLFAR